MTEPVYIKVSEVESALKNLWKKYQGTNVVRASLFNLVIYTKKDSRDEYMQKLSKDIIKKFPCRIIVITEFEEGHGDFLKTSVSDMMPEDRGTIFCDVINFDVCGSFRERIPFVVLPHLLPDRPVYLLWGDDPLLKDPISLRLENRATRTIFDSESSKDIVDFAQMILAHHKDVVCDIADLNWARCAPWRELFGNAFNSEELLKPLQNAKEVRIIYNTRETKTISHTKIQATYFQGWLATKLGWTLEGVVGTKEEICFTYTSSAGSLNIVLAPGKNYDLPPGRIVSIEILSHHNEMISFNRDQNDINKVSIHQCSVSKCDMPTIHLFGQEITGRSMMREIYNQGTDPSFIKVLTLLSQCKKGIII